MDVWAAVACSLSSVRWMVDGRARCSEIIVGMERNVCLIPETAQ